YFASSHLATASRSDAASAHSTRVRAIFLLQVSRNSPALASETACFCLAISALSESLDAAAPAFLNSRSTRWSSSCLHWSSEGAFLQPTASNTPAIIQRFIASSYHCAGRLW